MTDQLATMTQAGIRTFVFGVPGDERHIFYLNQFAQAGETPLYDTSQSYFEASEENDIVTTFHSTTESPGFRCVVPIDFATVDPASLNVLVDCNIIPQSTNEQQNWTFDESSLSIVLEGAQCERMQSQDVERIDVVQFCTDYHLE